MCADKNIRGLTPLGDMMSYVNYVVSQLYEGEKTTRKIIIGILADGQADKHEQFRMEVRNLSRHGNVNVYTPIYLATNDENIIDYFNDLDGLGVHLDVLDDYISEKNEVEVKNRNNFVNYCMELHIVRCAGVTNPVMDLLDEKTIQGRDVARFIDSIKFSGEQKFQGLSKHEFERLFRQRAEESEGFQKLFPDAEKVITAYGSDEECGKIALGVCIAGIGACMIHRLLCP